MKRRNPKGYGGVPGPLRPLRTILDKKARAAFPSSALGKLVKATKPPKPLRSGATAKKPDPLPDTLSKLLARYKSSEIGKFVSDLHAAVASNPAERKQVKEFLDQLGPLGGIVSSLLNDQPAAGVPREVKAALDFASSFSDNPDVLRAFQEIAGMAGEPVPESESPANKKRTKERKQRAEPGGGQNRVVVDTGSGRRRFPPDHPIVTGDMQDAPKSSNVHSYGYDLPSHSLYVRYLDHESDAGKSSRKPGPIYRYFNCPPEIFLKFLKADSKGSYVWDALRIRGTVSGHQLDYALVGVQNGYVPRKATMTPEGEAFIPRTVFSDRDRRLTSRRGFEVVRPMIPRPKDGKPNTGQP